ncbi:MAG: hypothetical protein QMC95_04955 [Desulfitobacteriaceae bacterium]|nr:hypothetical protein [Desulfitobacteriaceae bacterium]MDI6913550.1 hypothetical protein [Desulfitobacteriaceae bacterium]
MSERKLGGIHLDKILKVFAGLSVLLLVLLGTVFYQEVTRDRLKPLYGVTVNANQAP